MSESEAFTPGRILTAILPADTGGAANVREAFLAAGMTSFITHRTRGALPGCPVDAKGVPIWQEMVILEAVVPDTHAEELFRAAYDAGADGTSEGGMLLMGRARKASFLAIPEPQDEKPEREAGTCDVRTADNESSTGESSPGEAL